MRARTKQATEIADNAAQEVDSAIAKAHLNARLRSLDTEVDGLAFGRLDADDGDTWYVGRRHVEDERRRSRWSSTGGRRSPRPSTGPPPPTRSSSSAAAGSS